MLSVTLIQRHKNQYKPHSVQYFNCRQHERYDKSDAQQALKHNETKSVVFSVFYVKRIIINVCICTDKKRQQQGKNVCIECVMWQCTDTCFVGAVVGEWWMVNVLCTISVNRLFSQTMCKIELRNYILNNVICVLHIVPKQKGAFCQRCTQQLQFACICFLIRYEHKQRLEEQRMWETMAERKKRRKRWLKLEGKWTPHNFYIVCMFTLRYATIAFSCALPLSLS